MKHERLFTKDFRKLKRDDQLALVRKRIHELKAEVAATDDLAELENVCQRMRHTFRNAKIFVKQR